MTIYRQMDNRQVLMLLTEIGKLLKINIEFVSLETKAIFTALSTKKMM